VETALVVASSTGVDLPADTAVEPAAAPSLHVGASWIRLIRIRADRQGRMVGRMCR